MDFNEHEQVFRAWCEKQTKKCLSSYSADDPRVIKMNRNSLLAYKILENFIETQNVDLNYFYDDVRVEMSRDIGNFDVVYLVRSGIKTPIRTIKMPDALCRNKRCELYHIYSPYIIIDFINDKLNADFIGSTHRPDSFEFFKNDLLQNDPLKPDASQAEPKYIKKLVEDINENVKRKIKDIEKGTTWLDFTPMKSPTTEDINIESIIEALHRKDSYFVNLCKFSQYEFTFRCSLIVNIINGRFFDERIESIPSYVATTFGNHEHLYVETSFCSIRMSVCFEDKFHSLNINDIINHFIDYLKEVDEENDKEEIFIEGCARQVVSSLRLGVEILDEDDNYDDEDDNDDYQHNED